MSFPGGEVAAANSTRPDAAVRLGMQVMQGGVTYKG